MQAGQRGGDSGAHYACTTWTPAETTINLDQSFTQNRDCSQNQTRQRDVMNVWKSGKETLKMVPKPSPSKKHKVQRALKILLRASRLKRGLLVVTLGEPCWGGGDMLVQLICN